MKTKKHFIHFILYIICLFVLVITGFPFVFLLINSFKDMPEYLQNIWALPSEIFLGNYEAVFQPSFLRYFMNSAFVSGVSVLLIVVVSSMISFTFAKSFPFPYSSINCETFLNPQLNNCFSNISKSEPIVLILNLERQVVLCVSG